MNGAIRCIVRRHPEGVTPDPERAAYKLIRRLTATDFGGGGLRFKDDGRFAPDR